MIAVVLSALSLIAHADHAIRCQSIGQSPSKYEVQIYQDYFQNYLYLTERTRHGIRNLIAGSDSRLGDFFSSKQEGDHSKSAQEYETFFASTNHGGHKIRMHGSDLEFFSPVLGNVWVQFACNGTPNPSEF